jgi:hypothetical protein
MHSQSIRIIVVLWLVIRDYIALGSHPIDQSSLGALISLNLKIMNVVPCCFVGFSTEGDS